MPTTCPSATPCPCHTAVETFGHPNLNHPYTKYSLGEAVALTKGSASFNDTPIESLAAARAEIQRVMKATRHTWLTGLATLDVLDAAIDGRDLLADCRLV